MKKNNDEKKCKQTKTDRLSYEYIIIWMMKRDEKCSRQKHKLHIATLVKIIIYFGFAFIPERRREREREERKKYRIYRSFGLYSSLWSVSLLHALTYSSAFGFRFCFFPLPFYSFFSYATLRL